MDFQTKVVNATIEMEKGSPLKDFLSDEEIVEAIQMLADIFVVTGAYSPEELEL